MKYLTNQN